MQETLVAQTKPHWTMILSHSPILATAAPSDPILSQYLQTDPSFFASKVKPQRLFNLFRQAGPVVSVRMNVHVGNKGQTAVVQYWYGEHADAARTTFNTLPGNLKKQKLPPFSLRTFDPCSICCSGLGSSVVPQDLVDVFSGFGTITSTSLESRGGNQRAWNCDILSTD
ncbi:hypothetical protein BC629DRAFT_343436 [Irpex lacteus]|nr:hypothetical protein BC629DRAFT_343436 [Irpex lacteus]